MSTDALIIALLFCVYLCIGFYFGVIFYWLGF